MRGFSLVNRNANDPRLIRQRARDALTDPPGCIGAELEPFAVLIALGPFHQPNISFLYEIQQRQATARVMFCDIHDEPQVAAHQFVLCPFEHDPSGAEGGQLFL